jgi:hypothetical protein
MRLVLLPIKVLLGGAALAGAALGFGLGALGGVCCARLCRGERPRAGPPTERGAAAPGAGEGREGQG